MATIPCSTSYWAQGQLCGEDRTCSSGPALRLTASTPLVTGSTLLPAAALSRLGIWLDSLFHFTPNWVQNSAGSKRNWLFNQLNNNPQPSDQLETGFLNQHLIVLPSHVHTDVIFRYTCKCIYMCRLKRKTFNKGI